MPEKSVTMEKSVVCFMDVLGSQEAMTSPEAAEKLVRLKSALHAAAERMEDVSEGVDGINILWFTDNVLVTWKIDDRDDGEMQLGGMFVTAGWFMLQMAVEGFFVRGGVTVGDIHVDQHFAFGPALAEAVKLEHAVAVHPRTVLSGEAVQMAKEHMRFYAAPSTSPQASELVVDQFGSVFLNYLAMLEEEEDAGLRLQYLKKHQAQVETAIRTSENPRVRDKLQWLGRYHNHYAATAWPDDTSLLVDSELLADRFTGIATEPNSA